MNLRDIFYESKKLDGKRRRMLEEFCRNLNLKFKSLNLLDLAFHHRSFSNENSEYKCYNNERLEFLGDSVLGLATAAFLYEDMMDNPEGDLAKIKANVVSEKTLAPIGLEKMHIDRYLIMGRGEELSGGRTKKAILAVAIAEAAKDGIFLSKDDFRERTKVSKTTIELMSDLGLFGDMPESNQLSLFDFGA